MWPDFFCAQIRAGFFFAAFIFAPPLSPFDLKMVLYVEKEKS